MTRQPVLRPVHRRGAAAVILFLEGTFLAQAALPTWPLLLAAVAAALLWTAWRRRSPLLAGLLVASLFCGAIYGDISLRQATALDPLHGSEVTIEGTVVRAPSGKNWADVAVERVGDRTFKHPVKVRLARKWGDDAALTRGMPVAVRARLAAPQGARNPGGYDAARVLRGAGIMTTAKALTPLETAPLPPRAALFARLQAALFARLDAGLSHDGAALMKAILLGDTGQLADAFYHRAQLLGLVHIFAVSGLHVGFVLGFVLALARLFRQGRKAWLFFVILPLLLLYVALTGFPPAAVRAAMMALFALGLFFLHRYRDPVGILAYAALALLLINPWCLWQLGFQLSFAVTAGLIYLTPRIALLLTPLPQRLAEGLAVALAAEVVSAPFIAYHYHLLTPLGVVANLLMVPLVGCLVPLVFLALLLSLFGMTPALPFFWVAERLIDVLLFLIRVPGKTLAASHLHLGMPSLWALVLVTLVIIAFAVGWPQRALQRLHHSPRWALLLLPLCLITLYHPAPRDLALSVVDVGQGSAAAWQTADGRWLVFDCGPGVDTMASYLRSCGVNRIDAIVLSHGDDDHIGGLARLLEDFRVGQLYLSERVTQSEKWPAIAPLLSDTESVIVRHNAAFQAGSTNVELALIGHSDAPDAPNADEVAAYLRDGSVQVLFPGDSDAVALREVPWSGPVDVLLVPHHGSKGSLEEGFLARSAPALAIASAGVDNRFGHPDQEVRETYERLEIPFMCTNECGAILINRVAEGLAVSTWLQMSRKTGQEFSDVI